MKKYARRPGRAAALVSLVLVIAVAASPALRRAAAQTGCELPPPEDGMGCGGNGQELESQCWQSGGYWQGAPQCECDYPYVGPQPGGSPVLLDTDGDGFELTSAAGGVRFDLNGDGRTEQLSWTSARADDAWLALDRNGNGKIDSGRELFGNFTLQPPSDAPNGFTALAVFDGPERGGNGDGVIDARDPVFTWLRLWRDANHDGVSDPGELQPLQAHDVHTLQLAYKESKRADEHGNEFRYRAKIEGGPGAALGRWAWDVFLVYGVAGS